MLSHYEIYNTKTIFGSTVMHTTDVKNVFSFYNECVS